MIIVIFIVQPLPQEVNKYMECYVQDDKMITDFKVMSTRSPYPILKLSQFFFAIFTSNQETIYIVVWLKANFQLV